MACSSSRSAAAAAWRPQCRGIGQHRHAARPRPTAWHRRRHRRQGRHRRDAGDVSLTSNGNVLVNTIVGTDPATGDATSAGIEFADSAPGVVAQSIGGGGGAGGMNVTGASRPRAARSRSASAEPAASAAMPATSPWCAAMATTAKLQLLIITTFGDGSTGLARAVDRRRRRQRRHELRASPATLQSRRTATMSRASSQSAATAAAGDGGDVNVRHTGDILTDGDGSDGLLAQSIGAAAATPASTSASA